LHEKPDPAGDRDRIDHAFNLCLSRLPATTERAALVRLLKQERKEGPRDSSENRAWTAVARVLLNLDEFVTRE
jgi:hypothetical protein